MRKFRLILVSTIVLGSGFKDVNAQGIPVYDAASFTQMISQIDAMAKDYQKQMEQLDEAIKQSKALTGPRYAGDLFNSPLEQHLRAYLPNTWQDTMNIINAGNLPGSASATQGIYADLMTVYAPLSGSDVYKADPSGPLSQALDRRTGTTFAALAASEQAYNTIAQRIEIYERFLDELNNTEDLKASVDLQARISAENGMILTELMRINAIAMQQRASLDNESLASRRRASMANRFDPQKAGKAMILDNAK